MGRYDEPGYVHKQIKRRHGHGLTHRQHEVLTRILVLPFLDKPTDDWTFTEACLFWGLDTLDRRGQEVATWIEAFRVLLEDVQTLTGVKPVACGEKELTWLVLSNLLALHSQLQERYHKHLKLLTLRDSTEALEELKRERERAMQAAPRSLYRNGSSTFRGER